MEYIMETHDLCKSYKGRTVVNAVNIHVKKGEIYGFVGPNGAGKSTVMKMILNLIQPDAGEVRLFGEKVTDRSYESFKRVGSIIENPYFYDKMTARQNLELHCEYMGFPNKNRIDEVLQMVDLQNVEGKQICHYSLGMKQRLAIARAILARPEFLILDEPINALDPEGIREMRNLFRRLNQEAGTTIFISSHILSEVEQIADTVGIIRNGELLKESSMSDIRKAQTDYIELEVDDIGRAGYLLEQVVGISDFKVISDTKIEIYDLRKPAKEISAVLVQNGVGMAGIGVKKNSLEDYFFRVMGEA
ncbi:MAG: ABC transporter ATP-binding protein [Blautia massiliensis (ex Durand et al. 2017)]